jgi:hypothetical protein
MFAQLKNLTVHYKYCLHRFYRQIFLTFWDIFSYAENQFSDGIYNLKVIKIIKVILIIS